MDVVCRPNQVIDANARKVLQAKTVKVTEYLSPALLWSLVVSTARQSISGCLSNPCSVGICYQLNQHATTYVCICPDGTLNLACNATSMLVRRKICLSPIFDISRFDAEVEHFSRSTIASESNDARTIDVRWSSALSDRKWFQCDAGAVHVQSKCQRYMQRRPVYLD